jgi:hypothetical protein
MFWALSYVVNVIAQSLDLSCLVGAMFKFVELGLYVLELSDDVYIYCDCDCI